jgi:hypothetical protein
MAHCFGGKNTNAPLSEVVTYHAACNKDGAKGKKQLLEDFMRAARSKKSTPVSAAGV